jgi:hypothetical protein
MPSRPCPGWSAGNASKLLDIYIIIGEEREEFNQEFPAIPSFSLWQAEL